MILIIRNPAKDFCYLIQWKRLKYAVKFQGEKIERNEERKKSTSKSEVESKELDLKENDKGKNFFQEVWLNLAPKNYRI